MMPWFTFCKIHLAQTKPSGTEYKKFISGSPVVRRTTTSYKMCTLVNETWSCCIIPAPSVQQSYMLMRILIGQVKKILTSNIPLPLNSRTVVPFQCYLPTLFVWTKIRGANGSRVLLNCYIFRAEQQTVKCLAQGLLWSQHCHTVENCVGGIFFFLHSE